MLSSWIPVLPPVVTASAPRAALTVDAAAQAILDTDVGSLTELHVLGMGVADADDRIHLHPPTDVPTLVNDIGTLDLLVLDERLATAELVEILEAARDHPVGEQGAPVVVYHGAEDVGIANLHILPKAALAVVDAWERAVVPGEGGLVVLVDPARLATHPRLGHLLRHLRTPAYLTQRVFAVDLRRKAAEQRANGAVEAKPSSLDRDRDGTGAAVAKAEATAVGATERAQLATQSADELRLALSAAQERLLELVSETQEALRESAALRARLSEVRQQHTASLEARLAAEEAEKRQLAENLRALRSRERQLLENIRELEDVIVESNQAEARRERLVQYLEALASSTTWRWGHRIAVFLRRLTFRRPVGPSALDRALSLAKEPVIRGTGRMDVEG